MADPTGETNASTLRLDFDRHLMLHFRGSTITSDPLLAYRELDDALHLTDTAANTLADARTGRKTVGIGWRAFCANPCSGGWPATRM